MEQVAETLGVSADAVWLWEDGRVAPMLDRLPRLAALYGVSVDWLLGHPAEPGSVSEAAHRALESASTMLPEDDIQEITDYIGFVRERRARYRTGDAEGPSQ